MIIDSLAVVIPCYNVGSLCGKVIEKTFCHVSHILAIDDGSTDATPKVLEASGAEVITHPQNRGKGAALRTGFQYLLQTGDWSAVATMDGDGQHDPALLGVLSEPVITGEAELAIGSREFDPREMPVHRWYANKISSYLISRCLGRPIADIQCGYRVYSRSFLEALLPHVHSTGYEIETELLILAIQQKARVAEVPIPSIYTEASSETSQWRFFADSYRIARTVVRHLYLSGE